MQAISTQLSEHGQVMIPAEICRAHHWNAGLEFLVIDTGEGVLLQPKPSRQNADELALINQHAKQLNDEALDVLEYQVDL